MQRLVVVCSHLQPCESATDFSVQSKPTAAKKTQGIGHAPGRIDFMGGVADYSGSLVLEMPIASRTTVKVTPVPPPKGTPALLSLRSAQFGTFATPLAPVVALASASASLQGGFGVGVRAALDQLATPPPGWAKYVVGCFLVFIRAKKWSPDASQTWQFEVESTVPCNMGVSSSAAFEVSTLRALSDLTGIGFTGTELARLGQLAENEVVGAPCGLMDQLASAYGRTAELLPILCRPDMLRPSVALPSSVMLIGWPSGVKHSVGDSPYGIARAGAFMGKKILETELGSKWTYASEITPSLLARKGFNYLPLSMLGSDFLKQYKQVDDVLSTIKPDTKYPVRAALSFPIRENYRCSLVESLLRLVAAPKGAKHEEAVLRQIGESMLLSHAGYSEMGLGCKETDQMVDLLMALGPDKGIYGARISGGGSGGTVVVLAKKSALATVDGLRKNFATSKDLNLIY